MGAARGRSKEWKSMLMQKGNRKALALTIAIAVMFVLGMGSSASADQDFRYLKKQKFSEWKLKKRGDYVRAVPEPSAALVFGLGLLVASRFARRAR
jgi:hypothetical protein